MNQPKWVPSPPFIASTKCTTQVKLEAAAELEAQGLTDDDIMARCSEAWGIPLDELWAGCEDIERRYFA